MDTPLTLNSQTKTLIIKRGYQRPLISFIVHRDVIGKDSTIRHFRRKIP